MSNTDKRKFEPWPVAIIGFFVVAILGAVTFVVFCSMHPTDLVAADYYEQEVRYQEQMDRIERTRTQTSGASVSYESGSNQIRIQVPQEQVAGGLTGWIHLYRPSAAGLDQRVALSVNAQGQQVVDATDLMAGLWKVRVGWEVGGEEFFHSQDIDLKRNGS
jgi:hypothetical protein